MKTKEFFSKWKKGIQEVTPFQQARITFYNTWIIVFGVLAGIVISLVNIKTLWWLLIILIGALINTLIMQIGSYQKYKVLKQFEVQVIKEVEKT